MTMNQIPSKPKKLNFQSLKIIYSKEINFHVKTDPNKEGEETNCVKLNKFLSQT